jgi:C-terminal processing protease CtpA/Prc
MSQYPRRAVIVRLGVVVFLTLGAFVTSSSAPRTEASACQRDVAFLLDELEKQAGSFFGAKGVDWKAVRAEFTAAAKNVKSEPDHVKLCARLVARLKDGHAQLLDVRVKMPEESRQHGVGLALCEQDKKVLVKIAFGPAAASGIESGAEVISIDGKKALEWIDAKARELADTTGFSTAHAARYAACHWGFGGADGTTFSIEIDRGKQGKKKVTLSCDKSGGNPAYIGPLFPPKDLESIGKRDAFGKLASGYGYIVLRDCAETLPEEMDSALAKIGEAPGLILDMRANGGGGCDHEAVFGRFLAPGEKWRQYTGAGSANYTGPMVVIVDAGTRSTGETVSGMFKEDGRAFMIGPSPTHGMSAQKSEVEVPSKLFKVRFATSSNKQRFNGGKGIEGIGVPPNEVVAWNAKLMQDGIDPMVQRAEELLRKGFPKGAVAYAPKVTSR